ncbi:MAG TPA: SDR family oxidoreductase [Pirellulales bacterium]|jgi:nucleoside-diphosphate-sugar epimerase|nr:SDR family oxidoreductase [Pirellulales bacterium]
MRYLFLTGATGLVGRYLLRDLLAADVRVAAMARPGKGQAALEAIMGRWEKESGRSLPRPVVIEGDLCHPQVVPDAGQRRWLAAHCDEILHCAASMTFREDKYGEPFRTNRDGMQRLLDLCRQAGIRKFHHVSTAYICGLRTGRIYEHEIDAGQQNGNVYEQSKLAAEKMLHAADFIDRLTIYRPSSVVGDSQTGYTVSSHGFYLPLQLAYVMTDKVPVELMGERFFRLLGLQGDEGKNLVPVDWLSAAIVHLVTHPEHHGTTYHMSNPRPVTVRRIQGVVQEAIEKHSTRRFAGTLGEAEIVQLENLFRQYMDIYRSHWRDDPIFDCSRTKKAIPHLPCPDVDDAMLMRIASYPVKEKFILKRLDPPLSGFQPSEHLERLAASGACATAVGRHGGTVGIEISGRRGGQWSLLIDDGRVVGIEPGLGSTDRARCYLNSHTFSSLVAGSSSVEASLRSGRVLIEGNAPGDAQQVFVTILESLVSPA